MSSAKVQQITTKTAALQHGLEESRAASWDELSDTAFIRAGVLSWAYFKKDIFVLYRVASIPPSDQ